MCKIPILNFKIFVLVIKKLYQFQLRALNLSNIRPTKAKMAVFDHLKRPSRVLRQFASLFYPEIWHLGERWIILTKDHLLILPYNTKTSIKLTENDYNSMCKEVGLIIRSTLVMFTLSISTRETTSDIVLWENPDRCDNEKCNG